jgi:beta-lactamase class A
VIASCAIDLRSRRTVSRNADVVVPAASTVKPLISIALWRAVAAGRVDPQRRIPAGELPVPGGGGLVESMDVATALTPGDLDLLMLAVSDNAATNALLELLGFDAVNEEAERLGLAGTRVRRLMGDEDAIAAGRENTTTAGDLARIVEALATERHRRTLAAMGESHHLDIIPSALPAGDLVVACKQGDLPGRVHHDMALIDDGERPVALAVCSSPPAAAAGLANVAAGAYREIRAARLASG